MTVARLQDRSAQLTRSQNNVPSHEASSYVPALTGIRAFAALLVLVVHTNQKFPSYVSAHVDFLHRGYLGVDLFFILSGYIIAHVYLQAIAKPNARNIRIFLWHRFIRLFPAHAAVLIGLIALVLVGRAVGVPFRADEGWSFSELPWHILMLHAWGTVDTMGWNSPSWSISAELFAYLLFPALALCLIRAPRPVALVLALVALAGFVIVFEFAGWRVKTAWLGPPALIRVCAEFLCGACLCRAALFQGPHRLSSRSADVIGLGGLVGFVIAAQLQSSEFLLIALLGMVVVGASGDGRAMSGVFSPRPVVWLGEISYSLYIVHAPLLFVLRHGLEQIGLQSWAGPMRLVAFLAALVIVVAGAGVLFYVVEQPVRRRLRNSLGKIAPAPVERTA